MFFVNEAHRKNYESLLKFYESSLPSIEYEVACYVLALPEVLKRIPEDHNVEFPFDWAWEYDEGNNKNKPTNALFYMDDPYQQLVIAANHMYNGEPFRLNKGLDNWDELHFKIFVQACKIRGKFV
ncbi:DUF2538 family protein [Paenibacillus sp. Soil522]|uniref:DUF2538 family protein n=1 Tax=Paenibacillus sp. Soil522 TaxID=1736388 RepID=UPI0006FC2BE8|nr:DUF2538 family protein [Paenibacillus sp. Soil522]KRE31623.1 hypothetical protein ASG81_24870 [Paenibacillus sp. Soil522]